MACDYILLYSDFCLIFNLLSTPYRKWPYYYDVTLIYSRQISTNDNKLRSNTLKYLEGKCIICVIHKTFNHMIGF
jgi:hypothetical protein